MTDQPTESEPPKTVSSFSISAFWAELKRRHVVRVATVYAGVGWVAMEVGDTVLPNLGVPQWILTALIILVILGFPITLVIAWIYDLTPDGFRTTDSAEENSESELHAGKPKARHSLALLLSAAAVPTFVFGVLAIVFFFRARTVSDELVMISSTLAEAETISEKSVAVLPLTNLSPDPNNAFFADGVQEEILTNLSKIEELLVMARTSTLRYRDTVKSMAEIGNELGVRYLVEGSVRRESNQVRVTVQLIDTTTGNNVWAENYDRPLDDIFAIQSAIAKEIGGKLHAVLSPEVIARIDRRPTENQEAYDLFVKSRQLAWGGYVERRFHKIAALLEGAVVLDPGYADAWAFLASNRLLAWRFESGKNFALLESAHSALLEAERLNSGVVNFVKGVFARYEHDDFETAIAYNLEALKDDTEFARAHGQLAVYYGWLGRLEESQKHMEIEFRKDPLSPSPNYNLWRVYTYQHQWNSARALIQTNIERGENPVGWQRRLVQNEYLQTGDIEAFIAALENDLDFDESSLRRFRVAVLKRDFRAAMEIYGELKRGISLKFTESGDYELSPQNLVMALIWYELGDKEKWLVESKKAKAQITGEYPRHKSGLIICNALSGDLDAMEAKILEIREQVDQDLLRYPGQVATEIDFAIAYLVLGDHDKAIELLTNASNLPATFPLNREVALWFIFDRLRGDPRFDTLMEN